MGQVSRMLFSSFLLSFYLFIYFFVPSHFFRSSFIFHLLHFFFYLQCYFFSSLLHSFIIHFPPFIHYSIFLFSLFLAHSSFVFSLLVPYRPALLTAAPQSSPTVRRTVHLSPLSLCFCSRVFLCVILLPPLFCLSICHSRFSCFVRVLSYSSSLFPYTFTPFLTHSSFVCTFPDVFFHSYSYMHAVI